MILGFLFSLLLSGCGKQEMPVIETPLVKVQRVSITGAGGASAYPGEVRGRYESQLAFQVGGKIAARHVELGSRVRAGDVLFEIDTKDIRENLNIGAAQVESARAQLKLAEANVSRYRQLYAEDAVSAAQYEQYQMSFDAARASYQQAEAQYAQGSNALGYGSLTADSDGVISAVQAETGQVVAAGQSVVTLVKAGDLEVEVHVPENRLTELPVGQPVAVSFWALKGVEVNGVVREVSPVADPAARTYRVRVGLADPPPEIQLGMTASVVETGSGHTTKAVVIPLSAIYQTGGQPQVWVVEDSAVRLREVVVEAFGDNAVKVVDGLSDGDTVVVAGVHKLREGQSVRLMAGEEK